MRMKSKTIAMAIALLCGFVFTGPLSASAEPRQEYFDSVDHPLHGEMGMTYEEREYTLAVSDRDIDVLAALLDDPRYPDICGGFGYRDGTMYIFSLDDAAVNALVRSPLAMENIPYELVKTTVSLRRLSEVHKVLDADRGKYGIKTIGYQPRYNQVAVVPNDLERIDSDLRKLVAESKCVEIETDGFVPPPYEPWQGIPKDLGEYETVYTAEGSPFNSVLYSLFGAEPEVLAGAMPDYVGGTIYVYNLEQAKAIINANAEAKAAFAELGDKIKLVQVRYSPDDLAAAQVAMMNALEPLITGPYYSIHDVGKATIEVHGKGMSTPRIQKAARDAANTALRKTTGISGASISIVFADGEVNRATTGDDIYDRTYIGGPSVDGYYSRPWRRPPQ